MAGRSSKPMSSIVRNIKLVIDGVEVNLTATPITTGNVTLSPVPLRMESLNLWSKDAIPSMRFTVESIFPKPVDEWVDKPVEFYIDSQPSGAALYDLVFVGRINRRVTGHSQIGWSYGYEALGIEWVASQWPIISPFDGTGTCTFNLASTDTNYDPTYSDLSVAEMVLMILEEPNTRARLHGLKLGKYWQDPAIAGTPWKIDQRTRDDLLLDGYLASMRHPKPVTFEGDDLLQSLRGVLQSLAPNHTLWVQPVLEYPYGVSTGSKVAYGVIRFSDVTVRTTQKLFDFGKNPPPQVQRNYENAYPRVLVRGGPNVQPLTLSLKDGDISEDFAISPWYTTNDQAKTAWKLSVLYNQTGRIVTGNCTCRRPRKTSSPNEVSPTIPDPNNASLTIPNPNYIDSIYNATLTSPSWLLITPGNTPANKPEASWIAEIWGQNSNELGGNLYITRKSVTNGQWKQVATRKVADNTAYTTGGTSYLSLSEDLQFTDYSTFTMTATRWPGIQTWRRYKINAKMFDGTPVAKRVQPSFPAPIPWTASDGSVSSLTTTGVAQVFFNSNTSASATSNDTKSMFIGYQVDRQTEHIIFDRPVVTCFGSQISLTTGGLAVDGKPSEIRVLLPVSGTALETAAPADTVLSNGTRVPNYNGTSHTVDGLSRTKYINNREWVSEADTGMMYQWARQLLNSCCDTVVEGSTERYSYEPIMGPGSYAVWQEDCYATDQFRFLTSDIRGCTLSWNHADGMAPITTKLELSNRREPLGDQDAMVFHPCLYPIPMGQYSSDFKQSGASNDIEDRLAMAKATASADVTGIAGEGRRLEEAGLGGQTTANQYAMQAVEESARVAGVAERAGIDAANTGSLQGPGRGYSAEFQVGGNDGGLFE